MFLLDENLYSYQLYFRPFTIFEGMCLFLIRDILQTRIYNAIIILFALPVVHFLSTLEYIHVPSNTNNKSTTLSIVHLSI